MTLDGNQGGGDHNVGREVDVSTSCGLGRRTRPAALAALERTADLSAD